MVTILVIVQRLLDIENLGLQHLDALPLPRLLARLLFLMAPLLSWIAFYYD